MTVLLPLLVFPRKAEADTRKNGMKSLGNTAAATHEEISGESKGLTEQFEAGKDFIAVDSLGVFSSWLLDPKLLSRAS